MSYQDVESIFLVTFAGLFIWAEKKWPKKENLSIRSSLREDISAFLVLIIGVNSSRIIIIAIYDSIHLKEWTSIDHILSLSIVVKLLLLHLLSDFFLYWIHRGMHKWECLWKTHQWHHSPEILYWFSGFRTSFLHIFIYAFPQILAGFYLFDLTPLQLGVGFGLGVLSNLFTHSNLKVPEWLPLHYLIVTPDFHHPHHSQLGTQNKNFGNVFTIWDRLFGTYVDPKLIKKDFKYGLKTKPKNWRMIIGL